MNFLARRGVVAASSSSELDPEYIGAGAVTNIPLSTPTAIPLPAGALPDDLLLLSVSHAQSTPPSDAAPGGWTLLGSDASPGSDCALSIFSRIMQIGDGDPTVDASASATRTAIIVAWRDYTIAIFASVASGVSASATPSIDPAPTENDNDTIVQIWAADAAAGRTTTPSASWTEAFDAQPNALQMFGQYQQFATFVTNADGPTFSTSDNNAGIAIVLTNNEQVALDDDDPELVGTATATTGASSLDELNIVIPAAVEIGDLLVLNVAKGSTSFDVEDISGWTATPVRQVSTVTEHKTFYRVAQSGDAGATLGVTLTGATTFDLGMVAYRAPLTGGVVDSEIDTSSNTTDFSIHLGEAELSQQGFVVLVAGFNSATAFDFLEAGFRTDLSYFDREQQIFAVKGIGAGRVGYIGVITAVTTHGGVVALLVEGTP